MNPEIRLPILIIYPISSCNCRCIMCDYWKNKTSHRLTLEQIRINILPDCRKLGVETVVISGGEPLLHPDIIAICHLFHDAKIHVTLLTNGLQLREKAAELLCVTDALIVSLDGPADVHNRLRGVPDAYERLAAGIRRIRKYRPGFPVTARCTVQRQNCTYLRGTTAAALGMGVNHISFLAADTGRDTFARQDRTAVELARSLLLSEPDLSNLKRELECLIREYPSEFASGFIVESPEKLNRKLLQYFIAAAGKGPFPEVRCNAPLVSAVVEADGAVRSCFFSSSVGNISRGGLRAVLRSELAQQAMQTFQIDRFSSCHRCVCSLNRKPGSPA